MSLLGGGFCSTADAKGMKSGCFDDEDPEGRMESMAFVGARRGDYVQELSYKFVGDGNGEFEMVASAPRPRSNYCWFICMASALTLIIGVLFWGLVMEHPADGEMRISSPSPGDSTAHALAAAPVEELDCDVRELHTGDAVEASYAISFRPAGQLLPGAPGTVRAVLPDDAAEGGHSVVVDWTGHPQLQGSKVSRSQILQVVAPGDRVEALERIESPASGGGAGGAQGLEVDDLVLATADIADSVPQGTYGYVAKLLSVSEHRYLVDFPEFPQFANTRVRADEVIKAPLVADRVHAIEDIDYGAAGTILAGSVGTVATMTRERTTYGYVVDWDNHPDLQRLRVNGLKLKVVARSDRPDVPAIPQGSTGRIVATSRSPEGGVAFAMVAWDGLPQVGAMNVSRAHITKDPRWSQARRSKCCEQQGVGCLPNSPAAGPIGDRYNCRTKGEWSSEKSEWCCQYKALGCGAGGDKSAASSGPRMHPLFNCSTNEDWPQAKRNFCCEHERIGCGAAGSSSGWRRDVGSGCEEGSDSFAAVSDAADKARESLLKEGSSGCVVALANAAEDARCAGSMTPEFVMQGSKSVEVYTTKVASSESVGAQSSGCFSLAYRGCAVNVTRVAGCTHWLFSAPASPGSTALYG